MFGIEFPNKISITKEDEKQAKKKVPEFYTLWNKDKELRETIHKIYKCELPKRLTCYITTTKTSAIDLKKKFILLSMHRDDIYTSATIIHEFSHIAFLQKWSNFCRKLGYNNKGIQELKEVLTVINNIEYKDISDKGYSIHSDIREIVKQIWMKNNDLKKIISDLKIMKLVNSLDTIQKRIISKNNK